MGCSRGGEEGRRTRAGQPHLWTLFIRGESRLATGSLQRHITQIAGIS